MLFLTTNYLYDVSEFGKLFHQDPANYYSNLMDDFNIYTMLILLYILVVVSWVLINSITNKFFTGKLIEYPWLEFIWTLVPALTLIMIAIPSLFILYETEEILDPLLTVKVIGNQWYWSYEYGDWTNKEIDFVSKMILGDDLKSGDFRLREVDNRLVLPLNVNLRFICTASDVIHSFTIPSLGIKLDCLPGRLNQASFSVNRVGLFSGGCSEICGSEHSYMPIVMESVTLPLFSSWISNWDSLVLNAISL